MLRLGATAGLGVLASSCKRAPRSAEEISPTEDLMREHGVLNRLLLVYEECSRRLDAAEPPLAVLFEAAGIIRTFVEGYHERLEEDHLFPRFEKNGVLVDLVATLRKQHDAGRRVTARLQQLTARTGTLDAQTKGEILAATQSFVVMYRPHEAREDTVLFPAFRALVSDDELDELGERFEEQEHALFGKAGFQGVVGRVADLEKRLAIYDLAAFTPT